MFVTLPRLATIRSKAAWTVGSSVVPSSMYVTRAMPIPPLVSRFEVLGATAVEMRPPAPNRTLCTLDR